MIVVRSHQARGAAAFALGTTLVAASSLVAQAPAAAANAAGQSWAAWVQNIVNLMKVAELGTVVFSAYQFWKGRRERIAADAEAAKRAVIDSNYQAWQVINSAQGKGGSGGRVEALGDLLRNGVSLAGINLDHAWLERVQLPRATLIRSSLRNATLTGANLAGANLEGADLREADLVGANLAGAYLRGANIAGARLSAANLQGADIMELVGWREVGLISHTDIEGARNAPAGFVAFALERGAVDAAHGDDIADDEQGYSREFRAV